MTISPIVKWVGGKRQLQTVIVPNLLKQLAPENRYFEPFLGGGAIFFGLKPGNALLADINSGLINLYEQLRDNPKELIDSIVQIEEKYNSLERPEQEKLFYKTREAYNQNERKGINQAVNFLFLNKTGFNGIYRENSRGGFNVPFGKRQKVVLGEVQNLHAASTLFKEATLLNVPFEMSCAEAKAGDIVYFDPPYVPLTATAAFTSYSAGGFGLKEQQHLRDVFISLDKKGVKVALSNSSAPIIREDLYKGYIIKEIRATRNVSAKSQGRAPVTELIVSNFDFE